MPPETRWHLDPTCVDESAPRKMLKMSLAAGVRSFHLSRSDRETLLSSRFADVSHLGYEMNQQMC